MLLIALLESSPILWNVTPIGSGGPHIVSVFVFLPYDPDWAGLPPYTVDVTRCSHACAMPQPREISLLRCRRAVLLAQPSKLDEDSEKSSRPRRHDAVEPSSLQSGVVGKSVVPSLAIQSMQVKGSSVKPAPPVSGGAGSKGIGLTSKGTSLTPRLESAKHPVDAYPVLVDDRSRPSTAPLKGARIGALASFHPRDFISLISRVCCFRSPVGVWVQACRTSAGVLG